MVLPFTLTSASKSSIDHFRTNGREGWAGTDSAGRGCSKAVNGSTNAPRIESSHFDVKSDRKFCHAVFTRKKVSGLDEAGQWCHGLGEDGLDNDTAIFFKWRDILVF